MNCKHPTVVLDIKKNLPSYGESSISFRYDEGNILLIIGFDDEYKQSKQISISFEHVVFFKESSVPGVSDTQISYDGKIELGSLIEYQFSDFKTKWEEHFNHLFRFRHLKLFLPNSNISFEIICESFSAASV
jgi:hypothetical protein